MDYEYEKRNDDISEKTENEAERQSETEINEPEQNDIEIEIIEDAPEQENQEEPVKEQPDSRSEFEATEPEQPKAAPVKKNGFKKFLLALLLVIIGGAAAGGAYYGIKALTSSPEETKVVRQDDKKKPEDKESQKTTPTVKSAEIIKTTSYDLSELVEETMPSLVSITNKSVQEVQDFFSFFGYGGGTQTQEVTSLGSGVIIGQTDTELLIVTNAHVVDGASTLTVSFCDNESNEAYIKGSDSEVDIALIGVKLSDIKETTLDEIKIAVFGDSDSVKVGEQVMAIGNALGYGQSVTTGIISALHRTNNTTTSELIQTDAAINNGNSGGALFNMRGEVIGINNSKPASATVDGMGYAIPAATVKPIVEEYSSKVARDKVAEEEKGFVGITGDDVSEQTEAMYGIPQGIFIQGVVEGTGAEKAGLQKGYVIIKFDGTTTLTMSKLSETLQYYKAGETVEIVCMVNENNQYVEKTFEVTLSRSADFTDR